MFSCLYLELYFIPFICLMLFLRMDDIVISNHFLVDRRFGSFHWFTNNAIMKIVVYTSLSTCRYQEVELSNAMMNAVGILIGTTLNLVYLVGNWYLYNIKSSHLGTWHIFLWVINFFHISLTLTWNMSLLIFMY